MNETGDFLPFPFSTPGKEGWRDRKGTEKMKEREGMEGGVKDGREYGKKEGMEEDMGRERKKGREGGWEGGREKDGGIETSHLQREAGRVHLPISSNLLVPILTQELPNSL